VGHVTAGYTVGNCDRLLLDFLLSCFEGFNVYYLNIKMIKREEERIAISRMLKNMFSFFYISFEASFVVLVKFGNPITQFVPGLPEGI
jgi:hypothetical protein